MERDESATALIGLLAENAAYQECCANLKKAEVRIAALDLECGRHAARWKVAEEECRRLEQRLIVHGNVNLLAEQNERLQRDLAAEKEKFKGVSCLLNDAGFPPYNKDAEARTLSTRISIALAQLAVCRERNKCATSAGR